ncbi:MAG TPA: GWxTD domain-containing protein [Patescibacteria group bacterium]|nr:GWxTD domain-containing protein [Patescibacteria group bacterium]
MKKITALLLCFLFCFTMHGQDRKKNDRTYGFQFKDNYKRLASHYQEWLNMVDAIAGNEEIDIFLELPTVRDRDLFIRLFWQQRDPTPGTEANEYRNEIEKRFRHVEQFFGRGTPRPGWMTDQGRIYMILGEPNSTESFDNVSEIYPAQVWYYYGDQKLGLPVYFNITFYKPYGTGEWVILDPGADGPAALLVNSERYTSSDFSQIYQLLQKKAPTLAGPAFSMIPGQSFDGYAPSLRNSQIMANIYRSPVRSVNSAYAANFRKYKAYVNVDSSTRYIENAHALAVMKDDLWGYNIISFSVKPKKLSFDFIAQDNRYTLAIDLIITLKQGEKEIFSQRRHYELALESSQMDIIRSGGVVIHDSFPAVPGDYRLTVFMQNPLSKEFSFFESAVSIPTEAKPRLALPLTGFKAEDLASNFYCVYKAGSRRLAVDPDMVFAATQVPLFWLGAYNLDRSVWEKGRFEWEIRGLNENRPFRQANVSPLAAFPYRRNINAIEKISAAPLPSDFYSLTLKLVGADGSILDSRDANFQVSPLAALARPSEMYNQIPVDSPYYFDYVLAQQFRSLGDLDKAVYGFEKSLQARPDFSEARQGLLEILLSQGQFERVLREAELLPREGQSAFAGRYLKGQALFGMGDFSAALGELLEANKMINTDVNLVNLIGRAFLKIGDRKQAAQAFTASLALKKNQPEIEKLLAEAASPPVDKKK